MAHKILSSILCLLFPLSANAIELKWASGDTHLSFTQAARCTLVARAEVGEAPLPTELRLAWVAHNCPRIEPVLDAAETTPGRAQVGSLTPQTVAEARGNLSNALLVTAGATPISEARWILDLPAASRGKFQVIAPAPSTGSTARSNVVTFNGGASQSFIPVVLSTTSSHSSSTLVVSAVGVGIGALDATAIIAPDASWRVPLAIVDKTDTSLTAVADVPSPLPDAFLESSMSGGPTTSPASLLGDEIPDPPPSGGAPFTGPIFLHDPDPTVAMKDFAFVYNVVPKLGGGWRGLYHIMYIRHEASGLERTYGHTWSPDLINWSTDTQAFQVNPDPSAWDGAALFAPTLVQHGPSWYLVYSAVRGGSGQTSGDQSIGYASTSLLDTTNTRALWARQPSPAFVATDADFVTKEHPFQFRDPYVFPDPDSAGRYLMVYSGANRNIEIPAGSGHHLSVVVGTGPERQSAPIPNPLQPLD